MGQRTRNRANNVNADGTPSSIPAIDTSQITSGTLADARISESSVTQHSPATDLQPVKSDISALALREATNESSAAFSLPNQFIDTFSTDVLETKTDVLVTGGYVSSIQSETGLVFLMDGGEGESAGSQNFYNKASGSDVNRDSISGNSSQIDVDTGTQKFGSNSYYVNNIVNEKYRWEFNANADWNFGTGDFSIDGFIRYGTESHEHSIMGVGDGSNTGDFFIRINEWNSDQLVVNVKHGSGTHHLNIPNTAISPSTWLHICVARKSGTIKVFIDGNSQTVTSSADWSTAVVGNSSGKLTWGAGLWAPSGSNAYLDGWRIFKGTAKYFDSNFTPPTTQPTATVANATGTAIQGVNMVGSAKTKVGGTMLYKDEHGTATIGTDLKIYFTCNGGTNWTEAASYNVITPVYSSGIKQIRLGETTCTSGTDIRYKAVWANQAVASKETQLHGIGINY